MPKIKKNFGSRPFTTMFNDHFFDKRLSWGAVGMLSNVFSLPDDWEFSVRGFMGMHAGGERAVSSLIYELEWFGYLERIQVRDTNGKFVDYIYEFFNESQLPSKTDAVPAWKDRRQFAIKKTQIINAETGEIVSTTTTDVPYLQNADTVEKDAEIPYLQNADTGFADTENADTGFAVQLSTNELSTNESIPVDNQSINHSEEPEKPTKKKTKKKNDRLIDRELIEDIKEQINYEHLIAPGTFKKIILPEDLNAVVTAIAMLKTVTEPQEIGGNWYAPEVIHERADSIRDEHVEYVFECLGEKTDEINNIVAYLKTAVFNAPATMGAYMSNKVNVDKANYAI